MNNLLRIPDCFPECLDVLPGVPRQQGVFGVSVALQLP
jgi:hypothetical protein